MRTSECPTCLRYRGDLTCDAYPQGIPEPILTAIVSHRAPYAGDQGKLYRPIPNLDADLKKGLSKEEGAATSPAGDRNVSGTGVNYLFNTPERDRAEPAEVLETARDMLDEAAVERTQSIRRDKEMYDLKAGAPRKVIPYVIPDGHESYTAPTEEDVETARLRREDALQSYRRNMKPKNLAPVPDGQVDSTKVDEDDDGT